VQEGDRVQVGQIIAILDSRDRLQAAYEQAQEDVRVAQSKLAITQAGAKQGEINAQRAEMGQSREKSMLNGRKLCACKLSVREIWKPKRRPSIA
jgi:multidrug efflux pump subunit AcrA (membrane-fusion protein)